MVLSYAWVIGRGFCLSIDAKFIGQDQDPMQDLIKVQVQTFWNLHFAERLTD